MSSVAHVEHFSSISCPKSSQEHDYLGQCRALSVSILAHLVHIYVAWRNWSISISRSLAYLVISSLAHPVLIYPSPHLALPICSYLAWPILSLSSQARLVKKTSLFHIHN